MACEHHHARRRLRRYFGISVARRMAVNPVADTKQLHFILWFITVWIQRATLAKRSFKNIFAGYVRLKYAGISGFVFYLFECIMDSLVVIACTKICADSSQYSRVD